MRMLIAILALLLLSGCSNTFDNSVYLQNETTSIMEESKKEEGAVIIERFFHPSGAFFPEDKVVAEIEISNSAVDEKKVWIELQIIDHKDQVIYSKTFARKIAQKSNISQDMLWIVPPKIQSGNYRTELTVWDRLPLKEDAVIISKNTSEQGFMCYNMQENFEILNEKFWRLSNKRLGRTLFKSENVSVVDGILKIDLPTGILEGGEISSLEKYGYGAYEVRMMLPSVPSSITGFFLYEEPDYYSEIDIELYNQKDGKLLLTTYANGKVENERVLNLGFDPTKAFHNYRFEYYEESVAFYVDNQYVIRGC